jgi:endonuclease YncB( thermonuclease family)
VSRSGGRLLGRARAWTVLAIVVLAGVVAVPSAPAQDRDCGDFATQAAAQAYFIARGGPTHDPDRLDADSDGIACESLPCPCNSGSGSGPTPTPTSAPTAVPTPTATPTPQPAATRRSARIVRVIDGDTLRVRLSSGRQITVRLIGIDTPETKRPGVAVECGGTAASAYMRRIAFQRNRGRRVTVVSDPSQDTTDRYGRTLAYLDAGGKGDLGRLMLRAGWAAVYVFEDPFARFARYQTAANQAQARRVGVWNRCGGDFHRPA